MTIVLFTASSLPPFAPSPSDIGALLHARTKIPGGTEIGTFDSRTRPTGVAVNALIAEASNEVLGKVQTPTSGTPYAARVTAAISVYAAMLVELSYFPEQVRSDRSPYSALEKLYEMRIRALIAEGETGTPEGMGDGGAGGDSPGDASWAFPSDPYGYLVGWTTRWAPSCL